MADAAPAYPRRQKKKERTRAAIIAAANRLVHERGPSDVTVNDIADAADVHVTTLFNHFPTRGALFAALTEPDIDRLDQAIAAARAQGIGFFEFLRIAVHFAVEGHRNDKWTGVPFGADHHADPELVAAWLAYERRQVALLTDYAAAEFGLDPETDKRPFLIASMIVSANIQTFERWQRDRDGVDLEAENLKVLKAAEALIKPGVR